MQLSLAGTSYDVFIIAGQSNMDGRAAISEIPEKHRLLSKAQEDVKIYYVNPAGSNDPLSPTYHTGWRPLAPGLSVPPKYTNGLPSYCFGPELSFGRTIADRDSRCHLALIKVTQGNTSLSSDWNPHDGNLYVTFTNAVMAALAELRTRGDSCSLKGMIWHQGESDVKGGPEKYSLNLTGFINAVRHDFGALELPFVIGEIATNKSAAFRSAQRNVAMKVPHTAFVSADGLTTVEGTHFDAKSVVALGEHFAGEARRLLGHGSPAAQLGSQQQTFADSVNLLPAAPNN